MADDFASSFLRSYSAAQSIRANKEDREYLREQRARKRTEDARDDKYRKDVAGIARGTTQVSTAPETDTVSAETLSRAPEGFVVDDVPGAGAMPTPKKSVTNSMATKLADGVKNKVAELFGTAAPGEGSVGAFGMPAGGGAAPELGRDSTSAKIGATRAQTETERLRAYAAATAEVNPMQAMQLSLQADKVETRDIRKLAMQSSNTWDGVEKTYGQFNNGSDLVVTRVTEGKDKGQWHVMDGEHDLGNHVSPQAFYRRVVDPTLMEDPTATAQAWSQFATEDLQRERYKDQRSHEEAVLGLQERQLAISARNSDLQAATSGLNNAKTQQEVDRNNVELGLINKIQVWSVEPQKYAKELDAATTQLGLINPSYLTTVMVKDPITEQVTPVTVNKLTEAFRSQRPNIKAGETDVLKGSLKAAIESGEAVDVDALVDGVEKRKGAGAMDMLLEADPELKTLLEQAQGGKRKGPPAPADPAALARDKATMDAVSGRTAAPQWGMPKGQFDQFPR